jgi:hypothetical protein
MRYLLATIITAVICGIDWVCVRLAEHLNEVRWQAGRSLTKWEAFIVGAGRMAAENFVWTCVVVFLLVASLALFWDRGGRSRDDESESKNGPGDRTGE